jgi:hypothetical protein
VADFAARAVRDFVEQADEERWFQLLTIIRKAENPGVAAIQAILGWVAADQSMSAFGRKADITQTRLNVRF